MTQEAKQRALEDMPTPSTYYNHEIGKAIPKYMALLKWVIKYEETIRECLSQPATPEGWKPIETYDYVNFPLVLLAGWIVPSEYAQSNGSKPFWEISIGRCWHVNTRKFTGFLGQQPTHWMPLPAAPEHKGE